MTSISRPSEHIANSAAFRTGLRREKLAARLALAPAEHAALSARIERHLQRVFAELTPGLVAFCSPVRNEFDARPLVAQLLQDGWRAAMPVVEILAAPMRFRHWRPGAAMDEDPYGIPVPADATDAGRPDVLLLPLVAFDAAGYRLGYGGGYFDRTIAQLQPPPVSVGVGFELARVASIRPEVHDRRLDFIATESGVKATAF